jgi:hypothetical protein
LATRIACARYAEELFDVVGQVDVDLNHRLADEAFWSSVRILRSDSMIFTFSSR